MRGSGRNEEKKEKGKTRNSTAGSSGTKPGEGRVGRKRVRLRGRAPRTTCVAFEEKKQKVV